MHPRRFSSSACYPAPEHCPSPFVGGRPRSSSTGAPYGRPGGEHVPAFEDDNGSPSPVWPQPFVGGRPRAQTQASGKTSRTHLLKPPLWTYAMQLQGSPILSSPSSASSASSYSPSPAHSWIGSLSSPRALESPSPYLSDEALAGGSIETSPSFAPTSLVPGHGSANELAADRFGNPVASNANVGSSPLLDPLTELRMNNFPDSGTAVPPQASPLSATGTFFPSFIAPADALPYPPLSPISPNPSWDASFPGPAQLDSHSNGTIPQSVPKPESYLARSRRASFAVPSDTLHIPDAPAALYANYSAAGVHPTQVPLPPSPIYPEQVFDSSAWTASGWVDAAAEAEPSDLANAFLAPIAVSGGQANSNSSSFLLPGRLEGPSSVPYSSFSPFHGLGMPAPHIPTTMEGLGEGGLYTCTAEEASIPVVPPTPPPAVQARTMQEEIEQVVADSRQSGGASSPHRGSRASPTRSRPSVSSSRAPDMTFIHETPSKPRQRRHEGGNQGIMKETVGTRAGIIASKGRRNNKEQPGAFLCPICSQDITAKHNLKLHMNSHTGEHKWTCERCQRSFSTPDSCKRHRKNVRCKAKAPNAAGS